MSVLCPACGGPPGSPLLKHTAPHNAQDYTLYQCRDCDLQYWSPRRMEREFYEDSEHESYEARHHGKSPVLDRHKLFLKRFGSRARGQKLLDIGCADGSFLLAAKELGYEVWGLDLDSKSVEAARGRGLQNVYPLTLEEFASQFPDVCFDVLTAFEVLEHQEDPNQFLNEVKSLLKPDGIFVGSVPDRQRPLATRTRTMSSGDFPPHHFLWFSRPVLSNYLGASGFSDVEVLALHLTWDEMAAYLEYNVLGHFTGRLKSRLRNAQETPQKSEVPVKTAKSGQGGTLRNARTMILSPLTLALRLKQKGVGIYFEAKLME